MKTVPATFRTESNDETNKENYFCSDVMGTKSSLSTNSSIVPIRQVDGNDLISGFIYVLELLFSIQEERFEMIYNLYVLNNI